MDIEMIIWLIGTGLHLTITLISLIKNIKNKVATNKMNYWNAIKEEMKEKIVPLMEQAEKILKDPTEKENWVVKKLSDAMHIDFYKYADILTIAKEIIKEICETTKIEVNKNIVVQEKETNENIKGGLTNGIS